MSEYLGDEILCPGCETLVFRARGMPAPEICPHCDTALDWSEAEPLDRDELIARKDPR
jgi:hypothetical protein